MRIYSDEPLGELLYREYSEWFDLNNAVNGIMTFYTYGAAHYSALPMDINGHLRHWSERRLEELELELELLLLLLSVDELSSSALDSLCGGLSKTESFSLDELCSIDSLWVF